MYNRDVAFLVCTQVYFALSIWGLHLARAKLGLARWRHVKAVPAPTSDDLGLAHRVSTFRHCLGTLYMFPIDSNFVAPSSLFYVDRRFFLGNIECPLPSPHGLCGVGSPN